MKRALARRLADVEGFRDPDVALEQYVTSPDLAANVVHLADLHGDLDRRVVDIGTGTGMLALAAATRRPRRVVGLDLDRPALHVAVANEARVSPPRAVDWVQADATDPPLEPGDSTDVGASNASTGWTVVTNPPFGAQDGNRGADRAFLATARDVGVVSYSVHNAGSQSFVEAFAGDNGGEVTHAFAATLPVDAQFEFHTEDSRALSVEVFRIEWPGYS